MCLLKEVIDLKTEHNEKMFFLIYILLEEKKYTCNLFMQSEQNFKNTKSVIESGSWFPFLFAFQIEFGIQKARECYCNCRGNKFVKNAK